MMVNIDEVKKFKEILEVFKKVIFDLTLFNIYDIIYVVMMYVRARTHYNTYMR